MDVFVTSLEVVLESRVPGNRVASYRPDVVREAELALVLWLLHEVF